MFSKYITALTASVTLMLSHSGFSQDHYFGKFEGYTGLIGTLYDLKLDGKGRNTKVSHDGKGVNKEAFYKELDKLIRGDFATKRLEKFRTGDEQQDLMYLVVDYQKADFLPGGFGSPYIDPKGLLICFEGTIESAPEAEVRFAGYFDDVMMVMVNDKLVFYSVWNNYGRRKAFGESNRRKQSDTGTNGDNYGEYIKLKKGDKLKLVFAEVPGGNVGGALKVQLKGKEYKMDHFEDPILHPFVTKELDADNIALLKKSKYQLDLKEVPVFKFHQEE